MARKRKAGDGTVRQRKDGRWEGRVVIGYDDNGYPKTKNVLAKTKKECVEKLQKLKEECGEAAIHDISFSLRAGETLGIIGGTGSGKSTIANLIPRFYDTTEGTVRIYGEDVRSYTLDSLRQVIGVVPQKASLVSGTIAENLRWGDAAADDAELEHACKIAQAWEFVSQTSRGLETKVTQGGRSLSGGQKQRLTIARALVGHPKLLILDDSMSALDYATDLELRRQLAAEMGDVTKIMISQRATSIQHADHILVMDDGKCVGYGTHDELLVQCPVYADIYHTQMQ